ncbi:MAG TPA: hypothetical protein VH682_11505 [Gemmataceae bacterium]
MMSVAAEAGSTTVNLEDGFDGPKPAEVERNGRGYPPTPWDIGSSPRD